MSHRQLPQAPTFSLREFSRGLPGYACSAASGTPWFVIHIFLGPTGQMEKSALSACCAQPRAFTELVKTK